MFSRTSPPYSTHIARNPQTDTLTAHALAHTCSVRMASTLHKRWLILLFDVSIVVAVLLFALWHFVSELLFHCPVTIMSNVDDIFATLHEALAREG